MAIFDGFFDNLVSGVTNPKGNLGDWRHASRLFVDNKFQFAPHTKFLYHVGFFLSPAAQSFAPFLKPQENVVGMLVRAADLPAFEANVETKNKYNRKKNIQTNLEYRPINIDLHDDNFGLTTALLEAYFRYYYADANTYANDSGAYGTNEGDTTYRNSEFNRFAYGLDNNNPPVPFFDRIEITQFQRRQYTTYTLVRPLLSSWNHDNVDSYDSQTPKQNSLTVNYDTVFYTRGDVQTGSSGDPTYFGQDHYDQTPSPLSTLGGSSGGLFGVIGGVGDILSGQTGGILGTAIAGANVLETARNLTSEGLREEGLNLANQALGNIASGNFSLGGFLGSSGGNGLQIVIPKSLGNGGQGDITSASESISSQALGSLPNVSDLPFAPDIPNLPEGLV